MTTAPQSRIAGDLSEANQRRIVQSGVFGARFGETATFRKTP